MYRQFKLKHKDQVIVCWLLDEPELEVGRIISIKPSLIKWTIVERSVTVLENPPQKEWKVGGL